eukprot:CAMPEP_0194203140 /NCGR_PEP_ID=MMETSP0156-20130528/3002_1 /TAXON_ID=33649 /ORGANISM="Thalassionema nitzschioides, Strain L26-B" /LENGTH=72 /DNA_ID=CAMNT_0038928831 /DNA_START=69 /DNA_END=287 /DNA_ORIENTATION=+
MSLNETPKDDEESLADCLLSQYKFFVGGIGVGAMSGIHLKKGIAPMIVGGVAGSMTDLMYGYMVACKEKVSK